MSTENYLNHPTFGLLFRLCPIQDTQELFTTLYAQRLFFVVTQGTTGMKFEPVSRADARFIVENRMRSLRRLGQVTEFNHLKDVHHQTFQ